MARHWTKAERHRQALLINQWKPWQYSTGPKVKQVKYVAPLTPLNQLLNKISKHFLLTYIRTIFKPPNWLVNSEGIVVQLYYLFKKALQNSLAVGCRESLFSYTRCYS